MSKPKYDAIMLRCCSADMTSYGGYRWPQRGYVECPDWDPAPVRSGGLHGLAWGTGEAWLLLGDVWQAVRYRSADAVELDGQIKIPHGYVAVTGTREQVTQYIYERAPRGTVIHHLSLTGGIGATLTGGDKATLTAGCKSTLTGGYQSTLTGGYQSRLTSGFDSTLTAGYDSTLTGGDDSTLTGGDGSTLTGGDHSVLTGGDGSILTWRVWSRSSQRYRLHTVYVGEDGIEPDRPYTWRDGAAAEVTRRFPA